MKKYLPASKLGPRNKFSESGIAQIISDHLTANYNWDGIQGKLAFVKLDLMNSVLFGKCT